MEATPKRKYLITNLVYGDLYLNIFLNHHLRTILDETNLPAISDKYEIEYLIFTDEETKPKLERHPNMKRLAAYSEVNIKLFDWHREENSRYSMRYSALLDVFQDSVRYALEKGSLLTAWVADLIVARNFFPKIMERIEKGHGAVFVLPMRTAFESLGPILNQSNRALNEKELFELGYKHLHPLWTACDWNSPRFSRLPFALLWTNKNGMMARSFSITPIVFNPKKEMLQGRGMIDGDVPSKCDNPYWCENWTDAPVMGLEPLFCYYPTFANIRSSVKLTRNWARRSVHPSQFDYLKKRLYYPDKSTVNMSKIQIIKSDLVVGRIR